MGEGGDLTGARTEEEEEEEARVGTWEREGGRMCVSGLVLCLVRVCVAMENLRAIDKIERLLAFVGVDQAS